MKTITLELRPEDAEPILRENAMLAAKYGAWLDFITRKTVESPKPSGTPFDQWRKNIQSRFWRAKRIVESFGVEYEPTSEGETLTVWMGTKILKSHIVEPIKGFPMRFIDKSEDDPSDLRPQYREEVHTEACRQAANRAIRKWQGCWY